MHQSLNEWMDAWMHRWMDAWMHGWMDGWTDGSVFKDAKYARKQKGTNYFTSDCDKTRQTCKPRILTQDPRLRLCFIENAVLLRYPMPSALRTRRRTPSKLFRRRDKGTFCQILVSCTAVCGTLLFLCIPLLSKCEQS